MAKPGDTKSYLYWAEQYDGDEHQSKTASHFPEEILKALRTNDIASLEPLINQDNINKKDSGFDKTPLMMAASAKVTPETITEKINLINFLLTKGADIHIKDYDGKTAFMIASENGNKAILESLLEHQKEGEDIINAQDSNSLTALMHAALNGHTETVSFLIDKGADIHITTLNGKTALMFAAENGHLNVVKSLINRSLKLNTPISQTGTQYINLKSKNGESALVLANKRKKNDVVKLLLETPEIQVDENFELPVDADPMAKLNLQIRTQTNQAFKTHAPKKRWPWGGKKSTKKQQKGGKKSHKKQQKGGKKSHKKQRKQN